MASGRCTVTRGAGQNSCGQPGTTWHNARMCAAKARLSDSLRFRGHCGWAVATARPSRIATCISLPRLTRQALCGYSAIRDRNAQCLCCYGSWSALSAVLGVVAIYSLINFEILAAKTSVHACLELNATNTDLIAAGSTDLVPLECESVPQAIDELMGRVLLLFCSTMISTCYPDRAATGPRFVPGLSHVLAYSRRLPQRLLIAALAVGILLQACGGWVGFVVYNRPGNLLGDPEWERGEHSRLESVDMPTVPLEAQRANKLAAAALL